ncbi:hypothetical protein glysoja_012824 [Glycine soja]|nr:hypothetical protein glysoja_012824 [Glycine soja]
MATAASTKPPSVTSVGPTSNSSASPNPAPNSPSDSTARPLPGLWMR